MMTFVNVLVTKVQLLQQAKAEGKTFNRYETKGGGGGPMQVADRLNGNFLEWYPVFMSLLWALALTDQLNDTCIVVGWTYVALRALYMGLILKYGVGQSGMSPALWTSTFPAYACLLYLLAHAMKLFF